MSDRLRFRLLPGSIRGRVQLWLGFLLVCLLTGFGLTVDRLMRVSRFKQIDAELEVRVGALGRAVRESPWVKRTPPSQPDRQPPNAEPGGRKGPRPPGFPDMAPPRPDGPRRGAPPFEREPRPDFVAAKPDGVALPAETAALFGNGATAYFYKVWYRDGSVLQQSPGTPPDEAQPPLTERDTLVHWRTHRQFREAFHCSGFGDCVLAGRSIESDLAAMRTFAWALFAAAVSLLAAGLGVGGWLTARAIRPINRIGAAAIRISRGNLGERIETAGAGGELNRLAGVLNSTFARLEAAFLRQRQFTADAAHELRTPLAVIIAETQTVLARERPAAEYREALEVCLDAAQQMRRLTESLLELARLDSGDGAASSVPVDMAELAGDCLEQIRPLANHRGIELHGDFAPAPVLCSAGHLAQVVTNLLTNAIEYNRPDGEVRAATRVEAGEALLIVADTGVGIAREDLPHVFERFYCVDKARSRAHGHSGLGLAISRAIVEAAGGTIGVVSAAGAGTAFTVRLPLLHPPA